MLCHLQRITTKDGVRLDGIFLKPKNPKKIALLFVHGLTDCFYGDFEILNELAKKFYKLGIGLASFNTRGHGIVSETIKKDKRKKSGYKSLTAGGVFEKFEDCVFDIDAVVNFLQNQGYSKIIVCGISTGANKAAYYFSKPHSKLAKAAILLSPGSDILGLKKEIGEVEFYKKYELAQRMIKFGKGDYLMPAQGSHFPFSTRRYYGLYKEGGSEDIFSYGNLRAKFKGFSKIKEPILVVLGDNDKYLDRQPIEIIKALKKGARKTKNFDSAIIQGGSHSYKEKEEELTKIIINWILKI